MKPALLLLCLLVAVAHADEKPKAWKPGVSAPAQEAPAESLYTAPADRPLPFPPSVTRTLDLQYQPSVPDSIWPLVPYYRTIPTEEVLSTYEGSLRQDLPVRAYPVILEKQTVHAKVDGLEGQTHVTFMMMLPWFGDILPLPAADATLIVKVDDAKEQKWVVQFAPGPNLYIPSQRPLPVSNPTMVVLPLPPGPHRLTVQVKDTHASYVFLMIGQPVLTPAAIQHPR